MTAQSESKQEVPYRDWLKKALATDAERWAELERELARLRRKGKSAGQRTKR